MVAPVLTTARAHPGGARERGTLPGGPERESQARTEEDPPDERQCHERQIRRRGLVEQRGSEKRDARKPGERDRGECRERETRPGRPVRLAIDRPGEADGSERNRGPRDDLVGARADRHSREHRRECHPHHDGRRNTSPRPGRAGAERGGERTRQHHALEPEVDHPGPLGHSLSGGRQEQRRRHPHRRRQESARDRRLDHDPARSAMVRRAAASASSTTMITTASTT